ncbi:facilitated trehalose transporter Tret1-like [Ischnura elegans]|uniref:facilitated trehalose transporter Tret1-like n=1 Tax=Ischnura elegans TaxID=197161 RepID=UPI001ED8913B|nr:facilitated trehalose transporter Tret1-like [Ischnura elegans]
MDLGGSNTTLTPELTTSYMDSKLSIRGAIRQIWAALAVHSVVVIVGMTLGFSAILLPQLNEPDSDILITKTEASWLASIITIIAPIGSLMAGPVMQVLGSRATIMVALIPYALGWLLIAFSNGLPMLLVGRFISGLATTFGNTPCIVYITEISSPHLRPMLTATGPIGVSLGILLVYLFGWLLSWRIVAGIAVCFHLFSFAALCTIPESPVWLVSKGRKEDAHKALLWFHRVPAKGSLKQRERRITLEPVVEMKELEQGETSSNDELEIELARRRIRAEAELRLLLAEHRRKEQTMLNNNKQSPAGEGLLNSSKQEIKCANDEKSPTKSRQNTLHSLKLIVTLPTCYKPMFILFTLFLIQQFSGIYITLFYAVGVFEEMGGGALNAYIASVLVGMIRFFMSLVNIWLFKSFGRRPLCIFSACGMAVAMLVSGTFIYHNDIEESATFSRIERRMVTSLPPLGSPELPFSLTDDHFNASTFKHLNDTSLQHGNVSNVGPSSREATVWSPTLPNNISNTPMPLSHSNHSKFGSAGVNYIKTDVKSYGVNDSRSNSIGKNDSDSSALLTELSHENEQGVKFTRQKKKSIIPAVCMLLYVCVSMTGLLAIPWTLTAELFPTEVRSLANSLILSLVNFILFAALQSYPHMLEAFGPHGVLWFFSAVSAVGVIFVYFFLPETRNKSLADIESYFAKNTIYTKCGRK